MYLGTYVNIQIMRICTDTYTDTITHLFIAFYITSLRLISTISWKIIFPKKIK